MTIKAYQDTISEEFILSGKHPENCFSFIDKNKSKDDRHIYEENEFGHLWQGVECEFMGQKLVPNETIIYGIKSDVKIIQPEDFVKRFDFTELHPIISRPGHVASLSKNENDFYRKSLDKIKNTIKIASDKNNRKSSNNIENIYNKYQER